MAKKKVTKPKKEKIVEVVPSSYTVALMKVKTIEGVDGPRHFYSRIGTTVLKKILPEIETRLEGELTTTSFVYDETISKQVGLHVYCKKDGYVPLTPINK